MYNSIQSQAILNYTQETPPLINLMLRDINYKPDNCESVFSLMNAFQESPSLEEDIYLFRGVNDNFDYQNNFTINTLISTSSDIYEALLFTSDNNNKIILKILVSKGKKIISVSNLDYSYMKYLYETKEHILLPGNFIVLEIETFVNLTIIKCKYYQLETIENTILRLER